MSGETIENWVRTTGWRGKDVMDEWEASDDYDDPSTLTDQLVWLREPGFQAVTPVWQYYNFAVYGGQKPE